MNKQELLNSLQERRAVFAALAADDVSLSGKAVVKLLEQIEIDVHTLRVTPEVISQKARIYLVHAENQFIGVSSVPYNTPSDEWDKHAIEILPNCYPASSLRLRLPAALNTLRNVLIEAGVDVVVED